MKPRRKHDSTGVTLMMTPMIDIVFQLLIFFIMSFKIITQEGDFNVKMPLASMGPGSVEPILPPMKVRLRADEQGRLASISLNDRSFSNFQELHYHIASVIGNDATLQQEAEVELDCDPQLHYEHTVAAITAVSGYVDEKTNQVVKLVEKIKFTPPKSS